MQYESKLWKKTRNFWDIIASKSQIHEVNTQTDMTQIFDVVRQQ